MLLRIIIIVLLLNGCGTFKCATHSCVEIYCKGQERLHMTLPYSEDEFSELIFSGEKWTATFECVKDGSK